MGTVTFAAAMNDRRGSVAWNGWNLELETCCTDANHPPMRRLRWIFHATLWCLPVIAMAAPADWRLQLLAEEGVSAETAKLREIEQGSALSEARFHELVPRLGAQEFTAREQAEKDILRMGKGVLPWLEHLPKADDPEVRFRLTNLGKALAVERQWTRADLLRYAAASLLRERDGHKLGNEGSLIYAELFHDDCASVKTGYRDFSFMTDQRLDGKVTDGVLWLSGKHPNEGDQRLILSSRKITGKGEFPDDFQIEVMLGSKPGGEGGYHVGISVGNVCALFHPGFPGGGFRFERVDNHKAITENKDMGFTPALGEFQWMSIRVKRQPNEIVEIWVSVSANAGAPHFSTQTRLPSQVIGKLDTISLDRSGRIGGDAMFDNLVVGLQNP